MLKYISLNFLVLLCGASAIHVPIKGKYSIPFESSRDLQQIEEKWMHHVTDFLNLIDVNKVMLVVIPHLSDPDVLNFFSFALSQQFKDVVREFEELEEFKEAVNYLQSKGYDIKTIIDYIHSELAAPSKTQYQITIKNSKGITKLIQDLIQALPIENMKKLFEEKLETSPEVAHLFETLSSEEFIDILQRLTENPKSLEIKTILESYGLDFNDLNAIFEDIFGDYYL